MSESTDQTIVRTLSACRFRFTSEAELQNGIGRALTDARLLFAREVTLSEGDRIDFLVGRCGVEVKILGSAAEILRQLHRYAQSERVDSLVLVTSLMRHRTMPAEMNAKPVTVLHLLGSVF